VRHRLVAVVQRDGAARLSRRATTQPCKTILLKNIEWSASSPVSIQTQSLALASSQSWLPSYWLMLADPAAVTLPLHSTPMDEASGVQGSPGTQHVSPVFGKDNSIAAENQ